MSLAPDVLGAADTELVELVHPKRKKFDWPHEASADVIVAAFFNTLVEAAKAEQSRERQAAHALGRTSTPQKQNRQYNYLDKKRRETWERCSLDFLERRADIIAQLTLEELYSATAMQHFIEVDLYDLKLPPELRCSADEYVDGVNSQFLLDAARGRYIVDGQVFHFAEVAGDEAEDTFIQRLVVAIRQVCPEELLTPLTTLMCQSGLAALERASLSAARLAVCGGTQEVEYKLDLDSETPRSGGNSTRLMVLQLQVLRSGFGAFLLEPYDGQDTADVFISEETSGSEPMLCDAGSSQVLKTATVTLGSELIIDVRNIVEEIDIRRNGQRLPTRLFKVSIPRAVQSRTKFRKYRCSALRDSTCLTVFAVYSCVRRLCQCTCFFQKHAKVCGDVAREPSVVNPV